MSWRVSAAFTLKFREAVTWFRSRVPLTQKQYRALDSASKARAFTVANNAQLRVVQTVFDEIQQALENGTSFKDFKATVQDKLRGTWGASSTMLETTFRTNVQAAYNAGRHAQLTNPDVLKARPYWLYDSVLDSRTSEICNTANGTLLPAGHVWWDSHHPPAHFNCRSGIRAITEKTALAKGVTTRPPTVKFSTGFGGKPSLEWEPDFEGVDSRLVEIYNGKI